MDEPTKFQLFMAENIEELHTDPYSFAIDVIGSVLDTVLHDDHNGGMNNTEFQNLMAIAQTTVNVEPERTKW